MRYDTIIWDWNGTLLNDVWLCVQIVNELLDQHQCQPLDTSRYRDVFGFPIQDYYKRIGLGPDTASFDTLTEHFISTYESRVRECALHKDVASILQRFTSKSARQFILTAAHKDSVVELLDHFSIHSFFEAVEGLDNHRAESKVDRGMELLHRQGLQQETTVLIGDTRHDADVAHTLGVDCILVANGHQSMRQLSLGSHQAVHIVPEASELTTLIGA